MTLVEELEWRGLIKDLSSPELVDKLNNESLTFYLGTDPTADSLHLGHLSPFILSKRLKDHGHKSILLVGGATGRIGDPRPTAERSIIPEDVLASNLEGIRKQVSDLFGCDEVVDNYDWLKNINFIDYLRDFGKYFPVGYMLQKDTVRRRLEVGITYAEFSYMIMQAMDFDHLNQTKNVTLQIGGSDQWGNITAGVELIRKKNEKQVYALSMPLILDKEGNKFGKSEGNALWLDKEKTSSYDMYQYLINIDDSMVISYLKVFTFLTKEEIEKIEKEHLEKPELRLAQKTLAKELIIFLHGSSAYDDALRISEALFKGEIKNLSAEEIKDVFKELDPYNLTEERNIIDLLVDAQVCSSKREAREFITNNSISINGEKINDLEFIINKEIAIEEEYIIIRRGKKKYHIIKLDY